MLRALESNQYNHITATYFLLAERMLRERQEREQHQTRSPSPSKTQFRYPPPRGLFTGDSFDSRWMERILRSSRTVKVGQENSLNEFPWMGLECSDFWAMAFRT